MASPELYFRRYGMPWAFGTSFHFEEFPSRLEEILVPDLIKSPLLYMNSLLYPEIDFDRCRRFTRLGLLLLEYVSEAQLLEVEDEILPLLTEAISYCWFPSADVRHFHFLSYIAISPWQF